MTETALNIVFIKTTFNFICQNNGLIRLTYTKVPRSEMTSPLIVVRSLYKNGFKKIKIAITITSHIFILCKEQKVAIKTFQHNYYKIGIKIMIIQTTAIFRILSRICLVQRKQKDK